ncbi:MAG: lysozyme [Methylobacteriaceae bacterium]|jgi:GH24 family phage-related lysozyme (muramidase)|nr:lysozyme [Methylobacteriaceae bacterium]
MTRTINQEGLEHIKRWEGFRADAYKCPSGVWTIGYGHTSAAGAPEVQSGMTVSKEDAEAILRRDISRCEARVESLVRVPLTDNRFAALVSFDYNTGRLHSSTLLKKLNRGDYDAVPGELMKWVHAKGEVLQGLVNRRSAECGLWAKGEFVASAFEQAGADSAAVKADMGVASLTGAGALGVALSEAAGQIAPLTETLPMLKGLFIALILAGVAVSLWSAVSRWREA